MRTILILLSLLLFAEIAASQNVLVITNNRNGKQIIYKKGETIRYKLYNEEYYISSVIKEVTDTSFIAGKNNISLSRVERIDRQRKEFKYFPLRKLGFYFQFVGGVFILAETVNAAFVEGQDFDVSSWAFITGASLVVGGEILKHVEKRRLKIGDKYKLKVFDINYNYE